MSVHTLVIETGRWANRILSNDTHDTFKLLLFDVRHNIVVKDDLTNNWERDLVPW